jgi:hypothetical protein
VHAPLQRLDGADFGHLLDIGAGGEAFLAARQHNSARRRVLAALRQVLGEQFPHLEIERVAGLGAVDAQ